LPLAKKRSRRADENKFVTVVGGGSGVGITADDGLLLISQWLQEIEDGRKMKFADEKVEIEQVIIAYDALTVIVNPANSV
jgi:phosphate transport system substrate-binding protein